MFRFISVALSMVQYNPQYPSTISSTCLLFANSTNSRSYHQSVSLSIPHQYLKTIEKLTANLLIPIHRIHNLIHLPIRHILPQTRHHLPKLRRRNRALERRIERRPCSFEVCFAVCLFRGTGFLFWSGDFDGWGAGAAGHHGDEF